MNNEFIYVSMIADSIHAGHIRILKEASKYGTVIVGLLTEDICKEIEDIPFLPYEYREEALKSISYVYDIVPQSTVDGIDNLRQLNCKIVVHGDNWKTGKLSKVRENVLKYLESVGGRLIEVEYFKSIGNIQIKEEKCKGTTTTSRLNSLSRLLKEKRPIRILEVHNPISALIAENVTFNDKFFDGMWSSSLTDSTSRGRPDNESVDSSSRIQTVHDIFEVTTKPLIYDGDTGGKPEHFPFLVKTLERVGVSAIIIEDKCGLKKNSLFGMNVLQEQDTIENFSYKIMVGKNAKISNRFMIIARVESFIMGKSVEDAIERSLAYIKAGADGIMIHSKEKSGDDIMNFLEFFREIDSETPVILVPTTYNHFTATELYSKGANIIIYANHMLRSAYPAMLHTATKILEDDSSLSADKMYCMPIKEILELIPGTK